MNRRRTQLQTYQQPLPQLSQEQYLALLHQQQQLMNPQPYYGRPIQEYRPPYQPRRRKKRGMSGGTVVGIGMIAFVGSWFLVPIHPILTFAVWFGIAVLWMGSLLGWIRRSK